MIQNGPLFLAREQTFSGGPRHRHPLDIWGWHRATGPSDVLGPL